MGKFFKTSGVLDTPKKTLAPGIWGPGGNIHDRVRDQILETLFRNLIPKDKVLKVLIMGSITGYKYNDLSDVDVNVEIIDPTDITPALHARRKKLNGRLILGTNHPVNYFLSLPTMASSFKDRQFGVYNLTNSTWLSAPRTQKNLRDPNIQYNLEMIVGRLIAKQFATLVEQYREDYTTLMYMRDHTDGTMSSQIEVARKLRETLESFKDLWDMVHRIDKSRKFVYSRGWGTPRYSFRNITFKTLEHGPYGDVFQKIEKIKNPNELHRI